MISLSGVETSGFWDSRAAEVRAVRPNIPLSLVILTMVVARTMGGWHNTKKEQHLDLSSRPAPGENLAATKPRPSPL